MNSQISGHFIIAIDGNVENKELVDVSFCPAIRRKMYIELDH
jgi:hypothetical protein